MTELLERLEAMAISLVVSEATGHYERRAAVELMDARCGVAVINPHLRGGFAKATGQLAKTDAIDARILAQFVSGNRLYRRSATGMFRGSTPTTENAVGPAGIVWAGNVPEPTLLLPVSDAGLVLGR